MSSLRDLDRFLSEDPIGFEDGDANLQRNTGLHFLDCTLDDHMARSIRTSIAQRAATASRMSRAVTVVSVQK